ncbi:MAG: glycosyltransferase family 9 protein [Candidatus Nanoarchaeia archaeon]|nr:glycosyltransferase family 9 protein [Candidatus Nanoarchaeia archaeon]MDD5740537.1 glycosyltransferase family 9 protein [Candidatus Nanoarchaeia archaeon]
MDAYAGIPLISLLSIFKLRNKEIPQKINKILLIRLGNLGDAILSVPMIRELKRNFPKSKIYMLTSPKTAGVYTNVSYIDKLITINLSLSNLYNPLKILRKENFDLIIDMENYSRVTALFTYFIKPKFSIGFNSENQFRASLFDASFVYDNGDKHEVDCFFDLVRPLKIKIKNKELEFHVKADKHVDKLLKENKLSKKDLKIIIHPSNNKDWNIKRWSEERFASLITQLIKKYKAKIILIGIKEDKEIIDRVKRLVDSNKNLFDFSGRLNISQTAYLIKKCDLYIGNDTGPMHLSAAVQTPTIGIYGPVNVHKWGPYGKKHSYVCKYNNKNNKCWPCFEISKINKNCKYPLPCEMAIRVDDVMKVVDKKVKEMGR